MAIESITNEPALIDKILHYWNKFVTYETLSIFEIKISIECADTLNSLSDDVSEKKY